MHNTNEQRLDIIKNCDILLNRFLKSATADRPPEQAMIAQLTWLKERAKNYDLPLPIPQEKLGTLRYIYTDGTLNFHDSNPKDRECVYWEMEIPMERLLHLTKHSRLLIKDEYLSYIQHCIDALISLFNKASIPLNYNESNMLKDIIKLRDSLLIKELKLPLNGYMPNYESFIDYSYSQTVNKNTTFLFNIIDNLVFDGTRPDSWLTPEDAEREVQSYFLLE